MKLNPLVVVVNRVFSIAAFLLLVLAAVEWVANALGYTILRQVYRPGRLIEIAATFTIFVIALLLRQVREELRKDRGAS